MVELLFSSASGRWLLVASAVNPLNKYFLNSFLQEIPATTPECIMLEITARESLSKLSWSSKKMEKSRYSGAAVQGSTDQLIPGWRVGWMSLEQLTVADRKCGAGGDLKMERSQMKAVTSQSRTAK